MSIDTSERFAAPADEALSETNLGLQECSFSIEVVDDLDSPTRSLGQTR
jgi:hypothetical protein